MTRDNELIDLGVASKATKGDGGKNEDVGIGREDAGLSND